MNLIISLFLSIAVGFAADVEKDCGTLLLSQSVQPLEAKLLIKMNRSLAYNISLFHKEIDGKDRLLFLITENTYKRAKAINVGQEFLAQNSRPILGDHEKLANFPAGSAHAFMLGVTEFGTPIAYAFSRGKSKHRLIDENNADIEVGIQPSPVAKVGYGMNLSARVFAWVSQLTAVAVLMDGISMLSFGPEYSFGLVLHIAEWGEALEPLRKLGRIRTEHPWTTAAVIAAAFYVINRVKSLRPLYPPFVFQRERAENLVKNVDEFWATQPDVDQAVLVVGKLSSASLTSLMVKNGDYHEILFSDLFEIANEDKPKSWTYRFTQKGRVLVDKWDRIKNRWLPPEE